MRAMADGDRLAVRTMTSGGEEIAFAANPDVSDAHRAAAGRETVAARMRALLPANRRRAAAAYAAGGLPDGREVLRVWCPRDAAGLRERLGDARYAAWTEDDVLHVVWRGTAEQVLLGGGVQAPMWPVDGAPGMFGRPVTDTLTWRGPNAPARPDGDEAPLGGEVRTHTIESAALRGPRAVSVYVPPGATGPLPGCVLADGEAVPGFARVLETAIAAGAAPPVLLVGVHTAGVGPDRSELRAQEYLPRHRPRRFAAHLSFVTGEVIPWAESALPVSGSDRWIAAGFSNGAAWAIAAAQRRPEVFGGVAALSAGIVPQRVSRASHDVRHYLAAGTLEEGFRRATGEWAARLRRAGVPCGYHEWPGGHDPYWWHRTLPEALRWLLATA